MSLYKIIAGALACTLWFSAPLDAQEDCTSNIFIERRVAVIAEADTLEPHRWEPGLIDLSILCPRCKRHADLNTVVGVVQNDSIERWLMEGRPQPMARPQRANTDAILTLTVSRLEPGNLANNKIKLRLTWTWISHGAPAREVETERDLSASEIGNRRRTLVHDLISDLRTRDTRIECLVRRPTPRRIHLGIELRASPWSTEVLSESHFGGRQDLRFQEFGVGGFADVRILPTLDIRGSLGVGRADLYLSENGVATSGVRAGEPIVAVHTAISAVLRADISAVRPFAIAGANLAHYQPSSREAAVLQIGQWNPDFLLPKQTAMGLSLGGGAATRINTMFEAEFAIVARVLWTRTEFIGSKNNSAVGAIVSTVAIRPTRRY